MVFRSDMPDPVHSIWPGKANWNKDAELYLGISDLVDLVWGSRTCLSNKFPDDAKMSDLQTTGKHYWEWFCFPWPTLKLEHLAISWDIFGCQNFAKGIWEVVQTWEANHPKMYGTAIPLLATKNYRNKNINVTKEPLKNPAFETLFGWLISITPCAYPIGPYIAFGSTSYMSRLSSPLHFHCPSLSETSSPHIWITCCSSFWNGLCDKAIPPKSTWTLSM